MSRAYARKRILSSLPDTDDTPEGVPPPLTVAEVPISAKSLSLREQTRVRAALRETATRYANQAEFARDLGVGQQTVSKTMREATIGTKLAHRLAKLRHQTYEELVGGVPARRVYAELEGWSEAAATAAQRAPAAAIAAVSRWPASLPVSASPERRVQMVVDLARLWLDHGAAEEREVEETADAQREAEALHKPAGEDKAPKPRQGRKLS